MENNKGDIIGIEPGNGPQPIIQAATGGHFNYADPLSSDICVMDIAHALSNIPRFAGHTTSFYSVAQHSVMCVQYLQKMVEDSKMDDDKDEIKFSNATFMAALLHDAAEAFISDIPRPFKRMIPEIETAESAIFDSIITLLELDLDAADWGAVKKADKYMLMFEARHLLAPARRFRYVWGSLLAKEQGAYKAMIEDEKNYENLEIQPMNSDAAMAIFMDHYNELKWHKL